MSLRELPDFLKRGDRELSALAREGRVTGIGRGFPEARPPEESSGHDAAGAAEVAAREWLGVVCQRRQARAKHA